MPIEDAFVAILARRAGIHPVDIPLFIEEYDEVERFEMGENTGTGPARLRQKSFDFQIQATR